MKFSRNFFLCLFAIFMCAGVFAAAPTFDSITITDSAGCAGKGCTKDDTPTITLNNVQNLPLTMKISCNGTDWNNQDYPTATNMVEDFNIASSLYGCLNGSDGAVTVRVKIFNGDSNADGTGPESDETYYDSTPPTITITKPANSSTTASEDREFIIDVNDATSGISLSTITVGWSGGSGSFSTSACTAAGGNYRCDYNESNMLTAGGYTITVNASDNAGNAATQATSAFTYADTTAPAAVGWSGDPSAGDAQVSLTWNANSEADFNAYYIYAGTASGFTLNNDSLKAVVASGTTSQTITGLTNGTTYYFKIKAGDKSGNLGDASAEKSATPQTSSTTAPSEPAISSSTHSNDTWSTSDDVTLTWNTPSSTTGFVYRWNDTSDTVPADTETKEDITSKTYTDVLEGTHYFHLRACNGTVCSNTVHFTVKIDKSAPNTVGGVNASTKSNGNIEITWDEPSDSYSGVYYYDVYRSTDPGFGIDDAGVRKCGKSYEERFTDSDMLDSGITYHYRIVAIDYAGNKSRPSTTASAAAGPAGCSMQIAISVPDYIKPGTIDIDASSSGGNMFKASLKVRIGEGDMEKLVSNMNNISSMGAEYTIAEGGETGYVLVTAEDSAGNNCDTRKDFTIDDTVPEVKWLAPEDGAEVQGNIELSAEASDAGSGMDKVAFYYMKDADWKKIGEASEQEGKYSLTWEATELEAGQYSLKAEAADRAANASEAIIKASLSAVPEGEKKEVYKTQNYTYDKSELAGLLKNSGLDAGLLGKAQILLEENRVQRTLQIVKMGETYTAEIIVTFKNNSGNDMELQIIEVIPKDLAGSASSLASGQEFEVIQEDPVVRFYMGNVAAGEEKTLTYSVNEALDKEKADELIAKEAINEFSVPPIVLLAGEELGNSFVPQIDWTFWIMIIVGVLVLGVIVLGLIAAGLFIGEGSGAGYGDSGIAAATRGLGARGPLGGFMDDVQRLFKEPPRPRIGKFAYRGKRD